MRVLPKFLLKIATAMVVGVSTGLSTVAYLGFTLPEMFFASFFSALFIAGILLL